MNHCPQDMGTFALMGGVGDFTHFDQSTCLETSISRYNITCKDPTNLAHSRTDRWLCTDDWELCHTQRVFLEERWTNVAACIGPFGRTTIQQAVAAAQRRSLTVHSGQPNGVATELEVVLTGEHSDETPFEADEISLGPEDEDNEAVAAVISCGHCSKINYGHWPGNTDHFKVIVTMPHVLDVANVAAYIWS